MNIKTALLPVKVILALMLLLSNAPFVYAASATLSLSPSSGTFNKSCTFSLEIVLDTGGVETDGTDSILLFDPTRVNVTSIRSGTIYNDYPGNNFDNQTGKVTVSGLASVSQAYKGKGTLATVDFAVVDSAPAGATQIKFDFDPNNKEKTTDSNVVERGTSSADALNQVVNGSYVIGSGTCGAGSPGATKVGTGSGQLARGAAGDIIAANTPTPRPTLPPTGDFSSTFILTVIGGTLTLLGILGLVIL